MKARSAVSLGIVTLPRGVCLQAPTVGVFPGVSCIAFGIKGKTLRTL